MDSIISKLNIICNMDALEYLKQIPEKSVQTCITSPPYYNLRNYNVEGQIGLEKTPDEYIKNLVTVFSEVKKVLCDDGTMWVVIGDTYNHYENNNTAFIKYPSLANNQKSICKRKWDKCKDKDLIGIPWMLAFALRDDGWYLRQDIIWHKPNAMPESVKDRCTNAHEYVFLFSKSKKYYYDNESIMDISKTKTTSKSFIPVSKKDAIAIGTTKATGASENNRTNNVYQQRNKRSVWSVNTKSYPEAHFATYPVKLIEPCILASSRENDIVLDPFMGAGTTAVAALKQRRHFIGCELNPEYIAIAENRIRNNPGPPRKKITDWNELDTKEETQ